MQGIETRLSFVAATPLIIAALGVTTATAGHPAKLPNGEIPWPPVKEETVAKIVAALPDKPQVPPQKPRKLLP